MKHIILQPAANTESRKHYNDTIKNPISFDRLSRFLNQEEISRLESLYPHKKVLVWGVVPGKNETNIRKWERICRGDVVLFCRNNMIISTATVTHKLHNRDLALDLWSTDSTGNTWEYIYFLDELRPQYIPYARMNEAAEYDPNFKVQGFNVLDSEKSAKILCTLKLSSETIYPDISMTDFQNATIEIDKLPLDLKRFTLARAEQGFLRKSLFGDNRYARCCICGESYPVELMVAAHIKKRSECSEEEKRDYKCIVAPMCKLGCDELYERGFISVSDGLVVVIKWPTEDSALTTILKSLDGNSCSYWNEGTKAYFKWHLRMNNP